MSQNQELRYTIYKAPANLIHRFQYSIERYVPNMLYGIATASNKILTLHEPQRGSSCYTKARTHQSEESRLFHHLCTACDNHLQEFQMVQSTF